MEDIKVGSVIKFSNSDEEFTVDKIFPGNIVDLTANKSRIEWMPDFKEKLFSIQLVNYQIVKP